MQKLSEAATKKAMIRQMMNAIKEMLADKTLPKSTCDHLEALDGDLKKTWETLSAVDEDDAQEAALFEHPDLPLTESATVGIWCESRIHSMFTTMADDMFGQGYLTRDERKAMSHAIGQALDAFTTSLTADAPQLYDRSPWVEAPEADDGMMEEAATQADGGKNYPASDFAYVPDPKKPSTWKLRLTKEPGGDPDAGIVGAAVAALGKGFRGQKVQIPAADLPGVKSKVRAAWKKANPDKKDDEMPEVIKEAEIFESSMVPLIEKAIDANGMMKVKIIQPGWGSSGYYSPQVLKDAASRGVFAAGTKMYTDHPTPQEEADRPERSIKDLAAETTGNAQWQDDPTHGPGLYAPAKVINPAFSEALNELAPHIGVSIRALGRAEAGQAEGKTGPIIKEISSARSVDFVTEPGAGGRIVSMLEARRGAAPLSVQTTEVETMDEKALLEANAQLETKLAEQAAITARLQRILGTDGSAKMSKSLNNAIGLLEPREVIWEKLKTAATCEHRQRRSDPGHPEHCNIFTMHQAFSKPDQIAFVDHNCRAAGFGCIECKEILFENMMEELEPIQNRVKEMNQNPQYMVDVLKSGAARCKAIAVGVMDEVRTKIGVNSEWMSQR